MSSERQRISTGFVAILVVAVSAVTYIAGYFWLGTYTRSVPRGISIIREYRYDWLAAAYRPVGKTESLIRGLPIGILGPETQWDTTKSIIPATTATQDHYPKQ